MAGAAGRFPRRGMASAGTVSIFSIWQSGRRMRRACGDAASSAAMSGLASKYSTCPRDAIVSGDSRISQPNPRGSSKRRMGLRRARRAGPLRRRPLPNPRHPEPEPAGVDLGHQRLEPGGQAAQPRPGQNNQRRRDRAVLGAARRHRPAQRLDDERQVLGEAGRCGGRGPGHRTKEEHKSAGVASGNSTLGDSGGQAASARLRVNLRDRRSNPPPPRRNASPTSA